MNFQNWYLDLEKVSSLKKFSQTKIHEYYEHMLHYNEDGRKNMAQSLFNTLNSNGYLKCIRDEKIEDILDGNNSINT